MSADLETMVVITTGKQDRGTRATLGFSWACSSLALGKRTSVYLTMDGTIWAMQRAAAGIQVQGFEPLTEYMEQFVSLGGRLLACAPCTEYYCSFDREQIRGRLIDGVELVGLATVVSEAGPNCVVVTL